MSRNSSPRKFTSSERDSDNEETPLPQRQGYHDKIARMREQFPEDDDFLSPIGSPTEMSYMGGRDKFMELKRKLEDDQAQSKLTEAQSSSMATDPDVDSILENFRLDRSRSFNAHILQSITGAGGSNSTSRLENNPKFLEMYQQIKEKDHQILILENKRLEFDRIVMELQDTLQQKEKMIASKNEAAGVIQAKCQKEMDSMEEELKLTQKTLFDIEKSFSTAQNTWKQEKERFNSEFHQHSEKLKQSEAAKFELVTKTAELQEAMVILETQKEDIIKQTEYRHSMELQDLKSKLDGLENRYQKDLVEKENKLIAVTYGYETELKKQDAKVKELDEGLDRINKEQEEKLDQLVAMHNAEMKEKDEQLDNLEDSLANNQDKLSKELEQKEKELRDIIVTHEQEMEMKKEQLVIDEEKHSTEIAERDCKITELYESLDKAKALLQKLKVRYHNKMTEWKESTESKSNEAELQAKIVSLENHIAELEEEKGNLLLHLVDFDELQAAHTKLVEELEECKETNKSQSDEIDELKQNLSKTVDIERELNLALSRLESVETEYEILSRTYNEERVNLQLSLAAVEEPFAAPDNNVEQELNTLREIKEKYLLLQDHCSTLERDLLSRIESLSTTEGEIADLALQLENVEKERTSLESLKASQEVELQAAKDQLQFASQKENIMLTQYDEQTRQTQEQLDSLQEQIRNKDDTLAQLNNDIKMYDESARLSQEQICNLLQDIESRDEMLLQKTIEVENLVTEINLEKESELTQEQSIQQVRIQELTAFTSQKEQEYNDLMRQIEDHQTGATLAEEQLRYLQEELIMKDTSIAQYLNDMRAYDEATRTAQEQLAEAYKILETRDISINDFQNQVKHLQDKISEMEEKCANQNSVVEQIQALQLKNDELAKSFEESKFTLKENEETLTAWRRKMEENDEKNSNLVLRHDEVCGELRNRVNKDESLKQDMEIQLKAKDEYMSNAIIKRDDYAKRLKEENDQILALLNDKNDNITELMNSCSELKFLFEEKVEELNACAARKEEEIQMAVQQYDAQTKQAQEQLISLQLDIQARDELLVRQKNEINSQSEQNIQAQEQIISLQMDIQSRDELINQKKNELNDLSCKLREIEDSKITQFGDHDQEIVKLNNMLSQKDQELANSARKFEDEMNRAQDQIVYFQIDSQVKEKLLHQLRIDNEAGWKRVNDDMYDQQGEMQKIEKVNAQQKLEINSLSEQNRQAQEQIIILQMDIISRDESLNDRANEINLLNSRLEELENTLSVQAQAIQQANIYKNTIDVLNTEIEKYKSELTEYDVLRTTCVNLQTKLMQVSPEVATQDPIPVIEPEVVRTTAYLTTQFAIPVQSGNDEESQKLEEERQKQQNEIRELKIRNGKMMQKFKQLKDRYEAIAKENESLKMKNEFSLESTLQDELLGQVKKHESVIEEKGKVISELQAEREKLLQKVDIMEQANDKLTEVKDYQDRILEDLTQHKRQLDQEISGLKWRLDEVVTNASAVLYSEIPFVAEQQLEQRSTGEDDVALNSLRLQNAALVQELEVLQKDIAEYKEEVSQLTYRLNEMEAEGRELPPRGVCDGESTAPTPVQPQLAPEPVQEIPVGGVLENQVLNEEMVEGSANSFPTPVITPANIVLLQQLLEAETAEKVILERKIELLQEKISEIEGSEMKCYEENMALRSYSRRLEMDNLHHLTRWDELKYNEGSMSSMKEKALHGEVIRLVEALQSRDQRCEELTIEITRLLEERDGLQLKLSNVLKHNVTLYEEANKGQETFQGDVPSFDKEALKMKLAELEQINFNINMDLRREKKARHLMQEQLFFSQASRVLIRGSGIEPIPNAPPSPQRPMTPVRKFRTPSSSPPPRSISPYSADVESHPFVPPTDPRKVQPPDFGDRETEPSSSVKHI